MASRRNDRMIEGAEIRSRNFSGKEGKYNVKGQRNFLLLLDQATADEMSAEGYNVKAFDPREEGDQPQAFIKVKVNMDSEWPPQLYLVTSTGKTLLGADDLQVLDWSQITNADIIINPSKWTGPDGKEITTAYLQKGYFTIYEDELDRKYADVSDSALSSIQEPDPTDLDY